MTERAEPGNTQPRMLPRIAHSVKTNDVSSLNKKLRKHSSALACDQGKDDATECHKSANSATLAGIALTRAKQGHHGKAQPCVLCATHK